MFRSLRKDPVLVTELSTPPERLKTANTDSELKMLLDQLRFVLAMAKQVADNAKNLSKVVPNVSLLESEVAAEVVEALAGVEGVNVPLKIMSVMETVIATEAREAGDMSRLLVEAVFVPARKYLQVVPFVNKQLRARDALIADILRTEDKLAKYERERFTNTNAWRIPTLKKQLAAQEADFCSLESHLVDELRQVVSVHNGEYFESVFEAFAKAELKLVGEQVKVLRDVDPVVRPDYEASRGMDFGTFLEDRLDRLGQFGIVSLVPPAAHRAACDV
ncbi:unnamed protein product [Notodromas monacha]|uniref:Uncharacterized protein n=1 Tax=Notodromas monacha TaxID=399045 RepID=A0A7R9BTE4_9CRUS|nr:unnamed protein product [Notodromas monacha]CAG0921071.1 unnamed protein product [Notodromas monacha]